MSSGLTVRPDPNISILQRVDYKKLRAFVSSKDLNIAAELRDQLTLGFWDRFVIVILSVFSKELSAKKVASIVERYMPQIPAPVELKETSSSRMIENLKDFGLGQYSYLFIETK